MRFNRGIPGDSRMKNDKERNLIMDKRTVLFIDDEEKVLTSIKRGLRDEPYNVLFARSGKETLEILQQQEVHVVVTDMRMPKMDGLELLGIVKNNYPHIIRMILSGYANTNTLLEAINQREIFRFITKPWKFDEELKVTIHQAIELYDLHDERDRLIDELKQAHDQLEEKVEKRTKALNIANAQLKEHDRLKDEFIITMTHELRTPIAIFRNIISNAMAGALGKIGPKLKKNLEIAEETIDRLAAIISDLLDISKINSGKLQLEPTILTIQSIVNGAIESQLPKAESKNIELKTTMSQDEIIVNADSDKIAQVLTNLIDNAIKFTPDVGGCITIDIKDLTDEVIINVEDNGPGIAPDEIDNIFNRFVQISKQVGEGAHGTGLGLTIAKELVEMHGGRIWAESTTNSGAIFCFVLPKDFMELSTRRESICERVDSLKSEVDELGQLCSTKASQYPSPRSASPASP